MAFCRNCGAEIKDDSKFCNVCGTPQDFQSNVVAASEVAEVQRQFATVVDSAIAQSGVNQKSGQMIVCFVLGIASIVLSFIGYSSLGLLALIPLAAGIIGLIFAVNAHKHGNNSGLLTAGFICSIIGVVLSAISLIVGISWAIAINQTSKRIERAAEEYTNGVYRGIEKGVENAMDDYMDSITDYLGDLENFLD